MKKRSRKTFSSLIAVLAVLALGAAFNSDNFTSKQQSANSASISESVVNENTDSTQSATELTPVETPRKNSIANTQPKNSAATTGSSNSTSATPNNTSKADSSSSNYTDQSSKTNSSEKSDTLEVHFIDVGQGDSTLIKCGDEAMLIDAGNNNKGTAVQLYLKKQDVSSLKYIVGTHPDADHIGGLDVIITKFDITSNEVWMPAFESDSKTYSDVIDAINYKNYKKVMPSLSTEYSLGQSTVTVLGPTKNYSESNDNSIVIRITLGDTSFLFTGDATETAEANLIKNYNLAADVLKIGHHGSKYSTSDSFLSEVAPSYAVISVGANSYGHPTAEVLNKLLEKGVKIYRTDDQGSVIATSDGETITWNVAPTDNYTPGEQTNSAEAVNNSTVKSENTIESSESSNNNENVASGSSSVTVWIPRTGKKYHSKPDCSNMKNPIETTEDDAIAKNYGKCSKCW